MPDKLERYLEEISHYLAVGPGREEILTEIRSHILEKVDDVSGRGDDAALEQVIADFGPARRVAERYLEGQEIIAPSYRRYLFRYTSILFAVHFGLTVVAVIFGKTFVIFPFVFMPRLRVIDALMYLPMAFLADLGLVALILHLVTRSKKDIKLPWPKFAADPDEIKPRKTSGPAGKFALVAGLTAMMAITALAVVFFVRHETIFFASWNFREFQPLFAAEAGRYFSLIAIASMGVASISLTAKLFTRSRWVDVCSQAASLALIGLLLRRPFDRLFALSVSERFLPKIKFILHFILLFIAVAITIDLIKNLVILGREKLAAERS